VYSGCCLHLCDCQFCSETLLCAASIDPSVHGKYDNTTRAGHLLQVLQYCARVLQNMLLVLLGKGETSNSLLCRLQTQPPVRVLVSVTAPEQHDFDTQPLCEVSIRLRLRNCLQSPASLVVESGSRDGPQHQQSGNMPWPLCSIAMVSNGKSCMSHDFKTNPVMGVEFKQKHA